MTRSPPAVVLDTNIFVAAGFKPNSHAAQILNAVQSGRLRMVWTTETRQETAHILRQIPRLAWSAVASLFLEENRYTGVTAHEPFSGIADPDDRKFAALAQAAQAILITNDAHLLDQQVSPGVVVMTPRAFWANQQDIF
jgi:putative PIN family toxin of toxin-antitoxin system